MSRAQANLPSKAACGKIKFGAFLVVNLVFRGNYITPRLPLKKPMTMNGAEIMNEYRTVCVCTNWLERVHIYTKLASKPFVGKAIAALNLGIRQIVVQN